MSAAKKILKQVEYLLKLGFILALISNFSFAQNESHIKLINSNTATDAQKIIAFGYLVKNNPEVTDFETLFKETVQDEANLPELLKLKLKFSFFYETNQLFEFEATSELILQNKHCRSKDSSEIYNGLSSYYKKRGLYNRAVENLHLGLKIAQKESNHTLTEDIYSTWAIISLEQEKYEESIAYFKKSYDLSKTYRNFTIPYSRMNNLGLVYHKLKMYDSALFVFNQIIINLDSVFVEKEKNINSEFFYGLVLGNMGDVYLDQEKYLEAEPLLLSDLESSTKANELENMCISQINLAKVYLNIGESEKSRHFLDISAALIEKNKFRNITPKLFSTYAQYFAKIKDFEKSNEYYKKYILLNDSIYSEKLANLNVDLDLEFDLQLKNRLLNEANLSSQEKDLLVYKQKIQLFIVICLVVILLIISMIVYRNSKQQGKLNKELFDKNFVIKNKSLQLENALLEKELLLKEVYHRVKNNLQMVSSLLRLQASELNNEEVDLAMEESINRLQSMSLIHEKLYMRGEFQKIELKEYFETLIQQITDSFITSKTKIECKTDLENFELSIDHAVPLGLIINEIISNSFKHAFKGKDSGTISSKIRKENEIVQITLRDDGHGIPVDFEKEDVSFGTTLVELLIEQMDGTITRYNDNGTVYEIKFKDVA